MMMSCMCTEGEFPHTEHHLRRIAPQAVHRALSVGSDDMENAFSGHATRTALVAARTSRISPCPLSALHFASARRASAPQVGALCAMNSSLLMPAAFFLILFWRDLGVSRRTGTVVLLVLGLALLVMIVAQNVQSLISQAHHTDAASSGGGGAGAGGGSSKGACGSGWALVGVPPSLLFRACA